MYLALVPRIDTSMVLDFHQAEPSGVHIIYMARTTYVRKLHDLFLNLVRTCWNLTRIMNTPCIILVSFVISPMTRSCKHLERILAKTLARTCFRKLMYWELIFWEVDILES